MAKNILAEAFYSLGRSINKARGVTTDEVTEGVVGERLPELTLETSDTDLVKLSDAWEKAWEGSDVKAKWETRGDDNEKYWKGDHYNRPDADKTRPLIDNAIFEGLETYLPQVTRRNPEPMVQLAVGVEQTDENQQFAKAIQAELGELADELKLRLKLKGVARHHEIYLLGATKLSWDLERDIPSIKVIRPRKLILDPQATIDEDGYTGERIGEHRKLPAWQLVAFLQKEAGSEDNIKYITDELAKNEMATEIAFIEWWTADNMFWKLGSRILRKMKNPHWNYDQEQAPEAPITAESETGVPLEAEEVEAGDAPAIPQLPQGEPEVGAAPNPAAAIVTPGLNHFKARKVPYILMAIYTLGKQPVNETSNMGQNLASQDLINKRIKQIDKNADSMNGGMVVSLERSGLSKDQANGVTTALRKGGTVAIPAGAVGDAIQRMSAPGLPADVYNQLVDTRNRVRDVWGTRGSSPAGIESETTVRGKYLSRSMDTDRIGGGISEYLEQYSDDIYNWLVQLLYVYDDRFAQFIAEGVVPPKLKISVKEGSLLPKDSTTIANQAIELSAAGKMSLPDLYKRLDYPNPDEMAANVWLEANAPELLFKDPRVAQVLQQRAEQAAAVEKKAPSQSINFKDLPPEGKVQMAAQADIQLAPEAVVADEAAEAEARSTPALPQLEGAQ